MKIRVEKSSEALGQYCGTVFSIPYLKQQRPLVSAAPVNRPVSLQVTIISCQQEIIIGFLFIFYGPKIHEST